jgi:hypothetical protein
MGTNVLLDDLNPTIGNSAHHREAANDIIAATTDCLPAKRQMNIMDVLKRVFVGHAPVSAHMPPKHKAALWSSDLAVFQIQP